MTDRRVTEDNLTRNEWEQVSSDAWRVMMIDQWSRPSVPIGYVVYWIASKGIATIEPDDDTLNWAVNVLLALLKSGKITATGQRKDDPFPQSIPPHYFNLVAASFVPDDQEIDAMGNGLPHLVWNFVADQQIPDRFIQHHDNILIDHITITRDDMVRTWPPAITGDKRAPGRPGHVYERVVAEMIAALAKGYDLQAAGQEELAAKFSASRTVCRRARNDLSKIPVKQFETGNI